MTGAPVPAPTRLRWWAETLLIAAAYAGAIGGATALCRVLMALVLPLWTADAALRAWRATRPAPLPDIEIIPPWRDT